MGLPEEPLRYVRAAAGGLIPTIDPFPPGDSRWDGAVCSASCGEAVATIPHVFICCNHRETERQRERERDATYRY